MSSSSTATELTYLVAGMSCDHCRVAVTEEVCSVDGVETVEVDLPQGAVTVTSAGPVERADVAAAVDEAGYALA